MKLIKVYIFQVIFSIMFIIMIFMFHSQSAPTIKQNIVDFNSFWTIRVDDKITTHKVLPSKINNETMSEVTFEKELPIYINNGDTILFYTNHHSVQVFIDQLQVYQFKEADNSNSKTPGNAWHIIRLEKEYSGTDLKIIIDPSYQNVADYIPEFKYGKSDALLGQILKSGALSLLLCFILFIIGISIIIAIVFFNKQLKISQSLIWLGLFSVVVSMWSVTDINIIPLFIGHHLLINQISFICLKLVFIPVVNYSREIYESKDNKFINLLSILSIADLFVTALLQLLGIFDFKETIYFTHLLFITAAVVVVYINIKKLIIGGEKLKKTLQVHLISIVIVAIFGCVDLTAYYSLQVIDSGRFTKIGLLGYILILLYLAVNSSIKLKNSNEQLNRIKEFSKRDAVTQLSNRTAFQEDIYAIVEEDYINYSVAVFDLNNLKEFNDLYGHSMGDYYIIISSEVIQDVFGKVGNVYRIGGDEFCAIIKNASDATFTSLEEKMNKRMDGLNGMFFEKKMSIASGYASYDPKQDTSINDTFQRADNNMYEHKKQMKNIEGL